MQWDLILVVSAGVTAIIGCSLLGMRALDWIDANARSRERFANACLLCASLFIGLCLSEGLVRYWFRSVGTTADYSYFTRRWYADNSVVLNRLGFREREVSAAKTPGMYRIAVIGDSFTFGQGVDEAARFSNVISRELNRVGPRYEVLNFGRPGAETIDHIGILENAVLPLRPDFVLLQWFTNDVEGGDKSGRPVTPDLIPIREMSATLQKVSAAYYLINHHWKAALEWLGLGPGYSYDQYILRRFGDANSHDSQVAHAALARFIDKCREHRIPMGIVLFPRFDDSLGRDDAPLSFLLDRVLALCDRTGTPCLDLRSVFASIRPVIRLHVGKLDSHPGPFANALAARAILEKFAATWHATEDQPYWWPAPSK